ncbi:restriction endonuclease subunit S [Streptomyces sp. NPDC017413]|uniref:restriction endonuclease subunit S n=1 Tax=Streptomyces sp. NPDC017413 TaxID=3364994 RepID=UPI00379C7EE2
MTKYLEHQRAGWDATRLDRVATVNARIGWKALTASEYQPDGFAFLSTPNIKGPDIDFENVNFISDFRYRESPELQLKEGDVLLTKDGFTLGTVNVVRHLPRAATVNGSIAVLRPFAIDPRFLRYTLASSTTRHHMWSVKNGMDVLHLFQRDIKKIPILLPPIEEQHRIADFLDEETARIDRLHHLRTQHRALVSQRIRRRIEDLATGTGLPGSPSGNPWIGQVPHGWQILPMKRRWKIVDCKHRTPHYETSGYPVISPGDISPGRLDLSTAHRFVGEVDYLDLAGSNRRPRRGDIVYSRNASVGISAYVDTEKPFTMGQDVCRITSADQNQLFLNYVLNSVALAELTSLQVGSTFARVNIATLLELSIPCPPPTEQKKIARTMDAVSAWGNQMDQKLNRQLELLAERRQALITAAVTGQFDVSTASGRNVTDGV